MKSPLWKVFYHDGAFYFVALTSASTLFSGILTWRPLIMTTVSCFFGQYPGQFTGTGALGILSINFKTVHTVPLPDPLRLPAISVRNQLAILLLLSQSLSYSLCISLNQASTGYTQHSCDSVDSPSTQGRSCRKWNYILRLARPCYANALRHGFRSEYDCTIC